MDGRQEFIDLTDKIKDTFIRKNAGYAGSDNPDPWANFRHSEGFGVRPSTGVLVRISDKFARLQSLTRNPDNDQVGESREDSALDMAVYSMIYVCLLREEGRAGLPMQMLTGNFGPARIKIEHANASPHYASELCYAPENEYTPFCEPANGKLPA